MSQGLPNPGFMQEIVQKGDFLKKSLRELKFIFLLFQVPINPLKAWNAKLEACIFLAIQKPCAGFNINCSHTPLWLPEDKVSV